MSIWARLGNVINNYINEFGGQTSSQFRGSSGGDPDLDAAYEELDDFLNHKETFSGAKGRTGDTRKSSASDRVKLPPEELRADFECLGVSFGADAETCKLAYKKLLKIHHPDRHAGHAGNFKKATERSAKINAAWDRIDKWHRTKYSDYKEY